MNKKFYKSTRDHKLAGVCGGVAEYFDIDPTIVRVVWACVALCRGFGVLLYLICAIVFPYDTEL